MIDLLSSLMLLGVDPWISNSFPIIRVVLVILIILTGIFLIFFVMISPLGKEGGNVITGGSEQSDTFYSKNKSQMSDGFKKKFVVGLAIAIAVLTVIFFVTVMIYSGN